MKRNNCPKGKASQYLRFAVFLLLPALFILFSREGAGAGEPDCNTCHEALSKGKVVHAALGMGCQSCHTAIDASDVPHKKKNNIARGLSAAQPELCLGCHDNMKLKKKVVHAAVRMGCTGCHNPHSSNNAKLLSAELPDLCYNCHDKQKFAGKYIHAPVGIGMCANCHSPHQSDNERLLVSRPPDLCYNCHDKKGFTKKNVHAPVAGGMCLNCHASHASEEASLIKSDPLWLCLECHAEVRKNPHAVVGFSAMGHPIGLPRKGKPLSDPARPGKRFYCASCHNPHSSDSIRLFRYDVKSAMGLCEHCHKY